MCEVSEVGLFLWMCELRTKYSVGNHFIQNCPLRTMSLESVLSSQAASLSLLAASSSLPHCSLLPVAWLAA